MYIAAEISHIVSKVSPLEKFVKCSIVVQMLLSAIAVDDASSDEVATASGVVIDIVALAASVDIS